MNLDGEYRQAFVQDEAPNLDFGTAPFPIADDKTALAAPATSPATSSVWPRAARTRRPPGRW